MKAATITYLEMRSRACLQAKRCDDPHFWIGEVIIKQWPLNRFLYQLVGRDWHWTDKAAWPDAQWQEYVASDRLRTFVAYYEASVAGYFELRSDEAGGMEIAIFGLAPGFIGRGLGGGLLTAAVEEAWASGPERVWLHTCDLDHPNALANYLARGFSIFRVQKHSPTDLI